MNRKIPTLGDGTPVRRRIMDLNAVDIEDVRKLAAERDEAFAEVHRLRNFVQAMFSKEHALKHELCEAALQARQRNGDYISTSAIEQHFGRAAHKLLVDCRRHAADQAAENFDYEALGYAYEDDSGWEGVWTSGSISKSVFVRPSAPCEVDWPTDRKTLTVEFNDDLTNPVKSTYLV